MAVPLIVAAAGIDALPDGNASVTAPDVVADADGDVDGVTGWSGDPRLVSDDVLPRCPISGLSAYGASVAPS